MDRINREAWREPATIAMFQRLEGWTDPGERAAIAFAEVEARDAPILDLGVGAGRTVPLLRAVSRDYVAIDYTPELVDVCRKRHPGVRVLHGDARDLSRFPAGSFGLVVFSFNGIDAVSPRDRETILREVRRVLRQDGLFVFSAHNKEGPGHDEKLTLGVHPTRNPIKLVSRFAQALVHLPHAIRNHRQYSKLNEQGTGYSIMNAAAHDHGILITYVTLRAQLEQLAAAGFSEVPRVFGNVVDTPLDVDHVHQNTSDVWWFHFVARA